MNLHLRTAYEAMDRSGIFTPWKVAFQSPPNLLTSQKQIDIIMPYERFQAKDILYVLASTGSSEE